MFVNCNTCQEWEHDIGRRVKRKRQTNILLWLFISVQDGGLFFSPPVSGRARFVSEDRETVLLGAGLVGRYRNGQGIGHGFQFGCVDFSGFLFCSSSLVLMDTACCGCAVILMDLAVVVAERWWLKEILFYYNVYIILLC